MTMRFTLTTAIAAALALLAAAPSLAQQEAAYTVVETGQRFARLQDAVNAIGDGLGTIRIAPGDHADCAVQERGDVAYVAATPGAAVLAGVACEGKAALVLRGRSARVEGMIFAGIRVSDYNGAGIRIERGNLAVSQAWFRDSQQGILSAGDPAGTITVDKSTFTRLGTCAGGGGCAHSIYVGDYGALSVTRSRFEAGRGGHYLKARAARVTIADNSFDDAAGKGTNYMIDLPNGATGQISGNWLVQGRDKENHSAFIAIAAEGRGNSSAGLAISGNVARLAPDVPWRSVFVADWSGDPLAIGANQLGEGLVKFERR
ncbi:right-handed parallel beta-helix repeat-containing protein [Novosphingobium bradum]|uniref:Right-handed parallel beta-helix repeat-containing protein n=1 Tax=Novosphingobium bradum TaxID=1737444 RepID=A0ABV7IK31_9SPHN